MCNSSYLYHCEAQGAFRLPPGNMESMAKCKNQIIYLAVVRSNAI